MSFSGINLPSTRIPSDQSLWPPCARKRTLFGQHVLWEEYDNNNDNGTGTGRHLSPQVLEPYRQVGDPQLDEILKLLEEEGHPLTASEDLWSRLLSSDIPDDDNNDNKNDNNFHDPSEQEASQRAIRSFLDEYSTVPTWVNWDAVRLGKQVYLTYIGPIGLSLFYRSLVPGFSIRKIAAVLKTTGYLAPPSSRERVRARLMDTGAFVGSLFWVPQQGNNNDTAPAADVCGGGTTQKQDDNSQYLDENNIDSLLPGGEGWKAALQVRTLHAKVRWALLKKTKKTQSHAKKRAAWDTTELGVPINQEDMAATLLAFSTNALLGTEMIMGRPLPLEERKAYMAFWRYVGWLLGVPVYDTVSTCSQKTKHGAPTTTSSRSLDSPMPPRNQFDNNSSNNSSTPLRPLDPCGPGWLLNAPDSLEHSYAMLQSFIFHLMETDTDHVSIEIAHHLLKVGNQKASGKDGNRHQHLDNWFYFRARQCRRFIGDPLADALQLPYHPVWHQRLFLGIASFLYLWIVRVYTYAAMPWSPFRRRIIQFHLRKMNQFIANWREPHLERMTEEATNNEKVGKSRRNLKPAVSSTMACPFAMVASPVNE